MVRHITPFENIVRVITWHADAPRPAEWRPHRGLPEAVLFDHGG
jgi:hypothetical protein